MQRHHERPGWASPSTQRAVEEHDDYIAALKQCARVRTDRLPALEEYPDHASWRDPRLSRAAAAIITGPGADSRNGSSIEIEPTIRQFFDDESRHIVAPGTLDGGDVMMVGDHFYVGRSARTNEGHPPVHRDPRGAGGSRAPGGAAGGGAATKTVNYLEDGNMLVSASLSEAGFRPVQPRWSCPRTKPTGANCTESTAPSSCPRATHGKLKAVQDLGYKRWWWTPPNTARWTTAILPVRCASSRCSYRCQMSPRAIAEVSLLRLSLALYRKNSSHPRAFHRIVDLAPSGVSDDGAVQLGAGAGACSRQAGAA